MVTFNEIVENENKKVDTLIANIYTDINTDNENNITQGTEFISYIDNILIKADKAITNGIKGLINYLETTNIFIEGMSDYKTKTPSLTELYKERTEYYKIYPNKKFYMIENKKAPVMMGFSLTYKQLLELLTRNKNNVKSLELLYNSFDETLTNILNMNKDNIKLDIDSSDVNSTLKQVGAINKDLDTVVNKKVLKDRRPIKTLVSNFVELTDVINETIKLGEVYRMENLENIYKLNTEIVNKLNLLYSIIEDKEIKIDKKSLDDLTKYIEAVAKLTTSVAFLFYLYYQLVDMLVGTIKIIKLTDEDNSIIDAIAHSIKQGYNMLMNTFK